MSRDIKIIGIAVAVTLGIGFLLTSVGGGRFLGGTFETGSNPWFKFGFRGGSSLTQVMDSNGKILTAASSTANANYGSIQLDGGTQFGELNCATATWNPGSVATNTLAAVTSTDIALAGSAMGDVCWGSLDSATTTSADIDCNITGAATGTLLLTNVSQAALDIATGTARVCYFGF